MISIICYEDVISFGAVLAHLTNSSSSVDGVAHLPEAVINKFQHMWVMQVSIEDI